MSPGDVRASVRPSLVFWRQWLRLSVRSLMLLVLFLGGGLGLFVHALSSAKAQREAVTEIKKAGGGVAYDWQFQVRDTGVGREFTTNSNGMLRAPAWLVNLLGPDCFGGVIFVSLPESASDEELIHIGRLRRLELFLNRSTMVTDAGLAHLRGSSTLRTLTLCNTKITDAGMVHLAGLPVWNI